MNKIAGYPTFRRRLLANMPEGVASSFTELQLAMIERALDGGKWRDHPVDIRLSIPVLWRRCYLVILAGPERSTVVALRKTPNNPIQAKLPNPPAPKYCLIGRVSNSSLINSLTISHGWKLRDRKAASRSIGPGPLSRRNLAPVSSLPCPTGALCGQRCFIFPPTEPSSDPNMSLGSSARTASSEN